MTNHPDVGSHAFEFICSIPCCCGRGRNRIAFTVKAGDDPNFRLARVLMAGSVYRGMVHAVTEAADFDPSDEFPSWQCVLHVRSSVFRTIVYAKTREDARMMCRDIGGMRLLGEPQASFWERARLIARFIWQRRPQVTLRSPVLSPQ